MIFSNYPTVIKEVRAGDVIGFSGNGFISKIIKWKTRSRISHVGCIIDRGSGTELIESTTLKKNAGVSVIPLLRRVQNYYGRLYWFPLKESVRKQIDFEAYNYFLLSKDGYAYDTWQAICSATILYGKEDFSKLFCSELVCGALEYSGGIGRINCSEQTPVDVLRLNIFEEYQQFYGPEKSLLI